MNCITVNVFSRPLRVEYSIAGEYVAATEGRAAQHPQVGICGYFNGDKNITDYVERMIDFLEKQHNHSINAEIHRQIEEAEEMQLS